MLWQIVERAALISPGFAEAILHEQLLQSPTASNAASMQVQLPLMPCPSNEALLLTHSDLFMSQLTFWRSQLTMLRLAGGSGFASSSEEV